MDALAKLTGIEMYNKWFDLMEDDEFKASYWKQFEYVVERDNEKLVDFVKTFYPVGTFWKNKRFNECALKVLYEFKDDDFYKTLVYLFYFPTSYIKAIFGDFKLYMIFEELGNPDFPTTITRMDIETMLIERLRDDDKLLKKCIYNYLENLHDDYYSNKTYKSLLSVFLNVEHFSKKDLSKYKNNYIKEYEIDNVEDYFANNIEYVNDI